MATPLSDLVAFMTPPGMFQIPDYELIRELGESGMTHIYLALQPVSDRQVTLKVMWRKGDDAEKSETYFLIEGRTLAKLSHRNIVSIYNIVKSENAIYIAMEYLEGGTLLERLQSGLSLGETVAVIVQIASALQFAHDHGVVHRDLNPANILFRNATTPVLTDFGIAYQQDMQATRPTQTDLMGGTATYMSPEQINAQEIDGRSNLYSLGVLFYELITGKPLFRDEPPISILTGHMSIPVPPLPAIYAEFQQILSRMLAKNPDERYPTMKAFIKALKIMVVNNEMLWLRLQANSNQDASEQLRALGFLVSATHAEHGLQQATPPRLQRRLRPTSLLQPSSGVMIAPTQSISLLGLVAEKLNAFNRKRLLIQVVAGLILLATLSGIWLIMTT